MATTVVPSSRVTVAPGPVMPSIVGVSSFVIRSPTIPLSLADASCADKALRSIDNSLVEGSVETLPAASIADAVTGYCWLFANAPSEPLTGEAVCRSRLQVPSEAGVTE